MIGNALLLALNEIRRNMTRAFLTLLGVVIGVAAVVTMVTLGDGATRSVQAQVASLGSNLITLRPGRGMGPMVGGGAPPFRLADAEAIQESIGAVRAVAPTMNRGTSIVYLQRDWSTSVMGATPAYFDVANWTIEQGRAFTEAEYRAGRTVCVIGKTVRQKLFQREQPVGAKIRVAKFSCEVIGLLASKGQGAMGHDQDDLIVMPLSTVQRRLAGKQTTQDVGAILVSARSGAVIEGVLRDITQLMRERRRIGHNEDDDFVVIDTRQIADTLSSTTRVMTMLLGAVAGVSLLVGGIGIMNIMLVSVTERTHEIGIRLAIGAQPREVLLQFLIEAIVLSTLGGVIGILLGALASWLLAGVMAVPYSFGLRINVIAFLFSAGVGVVFGLMPARRAAQLDPIEALRHE
jgi:putative ABC transport system permease protein